MRSALVHARLFFGLAALCAAGCASELDDRYGGNSWQHGGDSSVNGVGVLAGMFEEAGHEVTSITMLAPRVHSYADAIVWCPDDFLPPSKAARDWMENWLKSKDGRTLIFVVRDCDAAPDYWAKVHPKASTALKPEIASRAAAARGKFMSDRLILPTTKPADFGWVKVDGTLKRRSVRVLQGDPQWLQGVDATKSEIELFGRILPADDSTQIVLHSGTDALVLRKPVGKSQILIVANGSFLLNLPLINKEHRKLAGRLIREVGPPAKQVVFLESTGSPQILDKDPEVKIPSIFDTLAVAPVNYVLFHLAVVAVLFCFSRWRVFGIPKDEEEPSPSDFGQHATALGKLLELTRDESFAQAKLRHFYETIHGDTLGVRRTRPAGGRRLRIDDLAKGSGSSPAPPAPSAGAPAPPPPPSSPPSAHSTPN